MKQKTAVLPLVPSFTTDLGEGSFDLVIFVEGE